MTDKEMAEEWVKSNSDESVYSFQGEQLQNAFLAGLEAGRPQWHKVSEQIPTEEKDYIVKLTDGTVDVMTVALDGNLEPYLLSPEFDFYKDVEKWCEIPKENE